MQRWSEGFETREERERREERKREAVRLAREEEERQALEQEQLRAADIEAIAVRTSALVIGAIAAGRLIEPAPAPPPQLPKPVEQPTGVEPGDDQVFTVDEICERNKISRSNLYKQWRRGVGPERFPSGASVRITRRAERLWR